MRIKETLGRDDFQARHQPLALEDSRSRLFIGPSMRTIAHLSDLHFGRIDAAVVAPLVESVAAARPDLVAVSGDLTQRARSMQFREAREFLDSLPNVPQII